MPCYIYIKNKAHPKWTRVPAMFWGHEAVNEHLERMLKAKVMTRKNSKIVCRELGSKRKCDPERIDMHDVIYGKR